MKGIVAWLYGPDSAQIRPLPAALPDRPPARPEVKELAARRFFEKLDGVLVPRKEPSVEAGAPPAWAQGERRVGEDGVTVRSPELGELPAAAPPPEPVAPPVVAQEAREPRPAECRAPETLAITSVLLEIPPEIRELMGRLPFKPRAPGTELARTMKVPVMNLLQGQTAPLGDDSITRAGAALPFVESTAGEEGVELPRLTLHEYASLRAELAVAPERSEAIRLRYHVKNDAALGALEERWQSELAASLEARAAFDKAFAEYTAWLRERRA